MQRITSKRNETRKFTASASRTLDGRRAGDFALVAGAVLAALAWLMSGGPAAGQGIERLGDYGKWQAYAFDENGAKACYIASQPTKDEGAYSQRGDIYAMVTHRPAEKIRDEVSLAAGYVYKEQTAVSVSIDGRNFRLNPYEDTAWAPDPTSDQKIVAAMKAGTTMVVQGVSERGTQTKDTYSLIGFSKAYQTAARACGY